MIIVYNFSQVQNQVSFTPVHKGVYKAFVMHIAISFQDVVSSHKGNIPLLQVIDFSHIVRTLYKKCSKQRERQAAIDV